jgi:hypothetical protein
MKRDEAVDLLDTVMQERDLVQMNNQNVLKEMQEKQMQLLHRVAYLEAINKNQFTLRMSQNLRKDKLKVILRFAQLLSPEIDTMAEKVNAIFDVLYDKRKHFQKYVRAKLKEELRSMIRMETCREIKKLYAPWRVLEVMDCSQQSLNQESFV